MTPVQPRLSWEPLWAFAAGRQWTLVELAERTGVSRRVLQRWQAEGAIPERSAERAAVALGLCPELLWGQAWEDATAHLVEKADAAEEAERAAGDAEAARRRAMRAERDRRYRLRHLERVLAAERERQRVLRTEHRAGHNAYRRAYFRRNRERILEQQNQRREAGRRAGTEGPRSVDEAVA